MTDKTKARISELCPEVKGREYQDGPNTIKENDKDITLQEVLRAILKVNPANRTNVIIESSGQFVLTKWEGVNTRRELGPTWNLLKNYDDQTQEFKDFLGELLGV